MSSTTFQSGMMLGSFSRKKPPLMQRCSSTVILVLIALILLLSSCATNNQVVQKGIFQHRKYNNPGWFVELPRREATVTARSKTRLGRTTPERKKAQADTSVAVLIEVAAMSDSRQVPVTERVMNMTRPTKANMDETEASTSKLSNTLKDMVEQADRIFASKELLALSNFLVPASPSDDVGGIDIFALLGFIFAFVFPIAGLVLSIIGLNRTKSGGRGHGLALAGVIISIVFILVYGAVFLR